MVSKTSSARADLRETSRIRCGRKAFREALRLKPDSFETLAGLGIVLESRESFRCCRLCRKALELKPDRSRSIFGWRVASRAKATAPRRSVLQNFLRYKSDAPIVLRELQGCWPAKGATMKLAQRLSVR